MWTGPGNDQTVIMLQEVNHVKFWFGVLVFFFLYIISRLFEDLNLKKGTVCHSHIASNKTPDYLNLLNVYVNSAFPKILVL